MDNRKIMDFVSGKKSSDYYGIYRNTQWFNCEEMEDYQLSKLKKLIKHCYANIPYYTKIMQERSIDPNRVNSLDYIKLFPILTKEIIKENYNAFTPINLSNIKGLRTSPTGGTTGSILYKRNDANSRSSVWGSYSRFYDWMGIESNAKILSYWGGHVMPHSKREIIKAKVSNIIKNNIGFDAYDTRDEILEKIANSLSRKKVQLIRSYPQALYSLALKFKKKGWNFKVKAIMTTSEPVMPQHRDVFREVFGAETFDQYGCGEIGGLAYECPEHNGLHITEERVYVEQNDNKELIITDLDNFAMPFIRYWNADQAEFSEEDCACGRKSKLIKSVMGRTCDYLIGIDGQSLHWAFFWHLLFDTEIAIKRNFVKFQIVQKAPDYLIFRTVSDPIPDPEKELLREKIRRKMGDMKVDFILEEDIENTKAGKFRPVINELL